MVISELGESLVETNLNLRSGDTLEYSPSTLPFQEEISNYCSPAEKAILRGENVATYDPFKVTTNSTILKKSFLFYLINNIFGYFKLKSIS